MRGTIDSWGGGFRGSGGSFFSLITVKMSSDRHDPNAIADRLAKIEKETSTTGVESSDPNVVATRLNQSIPAQTVRQPSRPIQPARQTQSPERTEQPEGESDESKPPAAALVKAEYSDEPQILVRGVKFGVDHPKREDARQQDVIVAKHVDKARDQKIGMEISKYNLNYVFADPDDRDHKFSRIFGAIDPNFLPATADLRPNWVDILDQLDLGSCVSNSVAYCIRYTYKKQGFGDFPPSRLFIYYNGRLTAGYPIKEDTGLTIRDGYKSVANYSVCSENNWPYVVSRFAIRPSDSCYQAAKQHSTFRYINLDNDAVQIKKSLKDGYPISFGAALFESFMSAQTAQSGIVPVPNQSNERRVGGHAMTIAGYDDSRRAFLVCNNWGTGWGLGGFCWFPYDYMLNDDLVGDLWSIRQWS